MNGPLISVILPVHNGERFVAHALNSVFAQGYDDLDVVVVDDGSTDGTAAVLARYGARITVIAQENAGPAGARNTGLAHARGDIVAFIDADDLWHPRKLEVQLRELVAEPRVELSICYVRDFWNGDPRDESRVLEARQYSGLNKGNVVQAALVRQAVFDEIGAFDPRLRFGEDTDFYIRVAEYGIEHRMLEQVLGYRRIHADNMTADWPENHLDIKLALGKAMIDRRRSGCSRAPTRQSLREQLGPGRRSGGNPGRQT
jgi:glycosyltransferase involved in cell wall biosynthesis